MIEQNNHPSERNLMDFILEKSLPVKKVVYQRDKSGMALEMDCEAGDWRESFESLLTACYPTLSIEVHYLEKKREIKEYSEDEIFHFLKTSIISSEAWLERACFSMNENRITLKVPNATVEKTLQSMEIENRLEEFTGTHYFLECDCAAGECEFKVLEEMIESEESVFCDDIKIETLPVKDRDKDDEVYHFGKNKFEAPTPLAQCRVGEMVTIMGSVFDFDERPVKNDKTLFILSVYDGTDSTKVKAFVKNQEAEAFARTFSEGKTVCIHGKYDFDSFDRTESIMARNMKPSAAQKREDRSERKRIELHVHTKMSNMDGTNTIDEFAKQAKAWGHEAIAITDDNVVQGYPDAMSAAKKHDIRILYGVDADVVDDGECIFKNPGEAQYGSSYVVFDLETTGFSPRFDEVTEIGAVKIQDGRIVDRFSTFVNPMQPIPPRVVELTHITNDMVAGADPIDVVLPRFEAFIGDSILVAHNASFDSRFIEFRRKGKVPYATIDTLLLARSLDIQVKNYKLGTLAKRFGINLQGAHRAVNDAEATAELFIQLQALAAKVGVEKPEDLNRLKPESPEKTFPTKLTIFPKNLQGLMAMYHLISASHMDHFFRTARMLKSEIMKSKEDFILGSGGEEGELIDAYLRGASHEELKHIASTLDYIEVAPVARYERAFADGLLRSEEDGQAMIRDLMELAKSLDIPVVASSDVRYMNAEDAEFLEILEYSKFRGRPFTNGKAYFMTTEEMLNAFSFLGDDAEAIVIDNPKKIAEAIEVFPPIPSGKYPPKIKNADVDLKTDAFNRAREIYGDPLPKIVEDRLNTELESIIGNGYAVMYKIAQQLVQKSNADGYYVGSRGSVGSSFVATMTGITEVNPLMPHYVCGKCKHSEFIDDGKVSTGFDLPMKNCPVCGEPLIREGHKIPFEVFLGFYGDKEPDIDLNFAGEYQPTAHKFIEDYFGEGFVFRAGTIGTLAEKTAFGLVKKFTEENNIQKNPVEILRLAKGIEGVKRTSGQHPGGIMVVPKDEDIHHFTPIQYPADEKKKNVITTHFDYHSISENILKLDILGHDAPTILRMLEDLTGVAMEDIPMDDPDVMSLFTSADALKVDESLFSSPTGTLGIPEFGTDFVVRMLMDTKPSTFGELVNISGLSHGTDVWTGNAQDLVHSNKATISEVISTREDIMNYLIVAGAENKVAFDTMEAVRKGRGLPEKYMDVLKTLDVPSWYFESCEKIKYMFPRAHAVAYVMTSLRIAWYKVHYPLAFYAAYFTTKLTDLNGDILVQGYDAVKKRVEWIEGNDEATKAELSEIPILKVVLEMMARGFEFEPIHLGASHYSKFSVYEGKVLLPISSLQGIGHTVAKEIYKAMNEQAFLSVEDMVKRSGASKTVVETLKAHGALDGIPKDNQLSLLDLIGDSGKM